MPGNSKSTGRNISDWNYFSSEDKEIETFDVLTVEKLC